MLYHPPPILSLHASGSDMPYRLRIRCDFLKIRFSWGWLICAETFISRPRCKPWEYNACCVIQHDATVLFSNSCSSNCFPFPSSVVPLSLLATSVIVLLRSYPSLYLIFLCDTSSVCSREVRPVQKPPALLLQSEWEAGRVSLWSWVQLLDRTWSRHLRFLGTGAGDVNSHSFSPELTFSLLSNRVALDWGCRNQHTTSWSTSCESSENRKSFI
jgi:hypothetical protein